MMENQTPNTPDSNVSAHKVKSTRPVYQGYTLKQRLIPTILLAFAAPLTVFIFGPLELYMGNRAEFGFAIWDFLPFNILGCLLFAAIFTGILLPLRGRAFNVVYAIIAWLSVMLFIQGNYLNFGLNYLSGDGLSNEAGNIASPIINTLVWVLVGGAVITLSVLIRDKHREIFRTVLCIVMVTVIGMQLMAGIITQLSSSGAGSSESKISETDNKDAASVVLRDMDYMLTYENLDRVGDERNIIYFVIDRFDWEYYVWARERCPEIFYNLDNGGFTYFDDAISLYPRTYPSVSYMFTGVMNDFEKGREDYFASAGKNSSFLSAIKDAGYTVNYYTDSYYGYENAIHLKQFVSNYNGMEDYTIDSHFGLSWDMVRLSLYRYLPIVAKPAVGRISTPDFQRHIIYKSDYPNYTTDMRDIYKYFKENPLGISDKNGKNYSFIHMSGTHPPFLYDEKWNNLSSSDPRRNDAVMALKQSFSIINLYLDQLKNLGLYEGATIIITGDHCSIGSDSAVPLEWAHVVPLFVKPSGSSDTPLLTSGAPVSHADLFSTILKSEGIVTEEDFGESVFDISEDSPRERLYYFQRKYQEGVKTLYEQVIFRITGKAMNYDNWEIVRRYPLGKSVYD